MGSSFVLMVVIGLFVQVLYATGSWVKPLSYAKSGDITLGGLFPLHYSSHRTDNYSLLSEPTDKRCERYNFLGFRWMQAMLFAVDEINNKSRSNILQNITLGFEIFDTCNTHSFAVAQTHYMINGLHNPRNTSISAVIGPTASDISRVTSNIFSAFDVPQVSYGSTSRLLSKKEIYNSFFRTIPNDDEQTMAILDLLVRYNWTWIGAIAGDDDYGRPGVAKLKENATKMGICIEYIGYVSESMHADDLQRVAKEVRDFNATVFVMFISAAHLKPLAQQLSLLNVSDKVWIASEAWATSDTIRNGDEKLLQGTLGIATRGGAMNGFRSYLRGVSPNSQPENPFIREFWEQTFKCVCPTCYGLGNNHTENATNICNGSRKLEDDETAFLNWHGDELEKSYNVYMAVHAVAHALDDISKCVPGSGRLKNGACPSIDSLEPWQLMAYVKHVNFTPPDQKIPFYFDEKGDPLGSYKLMNWVPERKSPTEISLKFEHIGNYSTMTEPSWSIDDSKIYWRIGVKDVPTSVCNPPCPPGTYRFHLSSGCCFECRPCPIDEYSKNNNSDTCTKCGEYMKANTNRTGCVDKLREYVRWNDGFGITFSCLAGVGVLTTVFVFCVFYNKRHTPLVKATNVELSFLLLFSLSCCFSTALLYIAEPQDWTCRARMVSFSLSFTFSVATVLVKTLRVLTAFEARVPVKYNKKTKWLGEHIQVLVVLFVTLLQAFLCMAWLLVAPPAMEIFPSGVSNESLSVQCSNGSIGWMASIYAYLALLAIIAFIFAFRARKLPENFNEAKFITFAMLVFLIVWLSFIPAYISTTGSMTTVVNCIAILASTFGFIGCLFFPKLYIIFVTPSRNTVQEMRNNTVTHVFRTARWHTSTMTPTDSHSPNMATERRANYRKKYVEQYNSLSPNNRCDQDNDDDDETESKTFSHSPKMIPSIHKDSTINLGVSDNILSSLAKKNLENTQNGALINLNLNLKVNIKSSTEIEKDKNGIIAPSQSEDEVCSQKKITWSNCDSDEADTKNKPFPNELQVMNCETTLNNSSTA